MSTRCNIVVKYNTIGNILYCHYDGYPEGVGKQLENILLRDVREWTIETLTNKLVNETIAEFDNVMHKDIDFMYEIDIKEKTLKCYKIDINNKDYSYNALIKYPLVMNISFDSKSTPKDSNKFNITPMTDEELEMFATTAAFAGATNMRERQLIIQAFKQGADVMKKWMLGEFGK
ncbi:MAG: hypothetical protein MJ211_15080 [Bacteroidales bacterium]|nr:hypothetical protein [Bacteroidales bacterium]